MTTCACGDHECMHAQIGTMMCRPCGEHHRGSECAINSEGQALAPCGCTWEQTFTDGHGDEECVPERVRTAEERWKVRELIDNSSLGGPGDGRYDTETR